jgi:hypothetical protein
MLEEREEKLLLDGIGLSVKELSRFRCLPQYGCMGCESGSGFEGLALRLCDEDRLLVITFALASINFCEP